MEPLQLGPIHIQLVCLRNALLNKRQDDNNFQNFDTYIYIILFLIITTIDNLCGREENTFKLRSFQHTGNLNRER
jgi:hypothetical protein